MRITNATNDNLVIQSYNAADYKQALEVAHRMADNNEGYMSVSSADDTELWVQVTVVWSKKQAAELREEYKIAKREVTTTNR